MEAELVSADEIITDILWTGYLLKAKGYEYFKSVMAQDNRI